MATLANRAKVTTATTGTGTITLGSAVSGFQTFAAAGVSNGATVSYVIEEGTAWEVGTGTYSSTGPTLTRTPSESSNAGSAINLAGAAQVYVTAIAGDLQNAADMDQGVATTDSPTFAGATVNGNITVTGTVDGRDVAADGTKLDGIEAGATADQTAAEIKTAYESNANTNAFTDAEQTKLAGIEAGADVTDTANVTAAGALMTTGGTLTGNLSFGDNDKAIFGAGSDLQIYHDGSNSYIKDAATGELYIQGDESIRFTNSAGTETLARFISQNRVDLYYDNAIKLATTATGVDVTGTVVADAANITGTVTADGLTVETASGGTLTLNNTTTSVGDDTLAGKLVFSTDDASGAAADVELKSVSDSFGKQIFYVRTGRGDISGPLDRLSVDFNGDISFYEDTGTTPKFFWDASAEALGIGTSSPAYALDVVGGMRSQGRLEIGATAPDLLFSASGGAVDSRIYNDGLGNFIFGHGVNSATPTERLRIDSSGRVGIGRTPTSNLLEVADTIKLTNLGTGEGFIGFNTNGQKLSITATDAVGAGMKFEVGASERMRIDSSGNLLVGTTDALPVQNNDASGIALRADGNAQFSRSGAATARFNRGTSDGEIVSFSKDGTAVGSIGAYAGHLRVGSGSANLLYVNAQGFLPSNSDGTASNGLLNLGVSDRRFKDLYLSGSISDGTNSKSVADIVAAGGGAGYFQGENGNTGDTTNGKGDIFRTHESTLNTNVTIASGDNSLAAGPLTVASGVTLTVSGNLSIV